MIGTEELIFSTFLAQTSSNLAEVSESVAQTVQKTGSERMRALILLIGVVVGLSVGKFVTFVGQVIVERDRVKFSTAYVIFLVALFLYQVYYWWSLWDLYSLHEVTFLSFFRLLLIPIFLYGATSLLTPDVKDSRPDTFHLGEYLEKQSKALCAVIFALTLTGLSQGIFLLDQEGMRIWLKIAGLLFVLPGIFFRNRYYTLCLSIALLSLVIFYIQAVVYHSQS